MGTQKISNENSCYQKNWSTIFNGLVHMLQNQQIQLQFLAKERELLKDKIETLHERWIFDANILKDRIFEMERELTTEEMGLRFHEAKSNWRIRWKQRDALMYKLKLDSAESELEDFREVFNILTNELSALKDTSKTAHNKGEGQRCKALEGELKMLKYENERLSTKHPEISALSLERDFVWNQYKHMESKLTDQLRSTRAEVERSNETVQDLLSNVEQLQVSNAEKDNTVVKLRTKMAKLESDLIKNNEEISRLSGELELLRKSRSSSVTPVLRRCTGEPKKSHLGSKNSGIDENIIAKKELNYSQVSEKGSRSAKRKASNSILSSAEAPKLFSSAFKPPKLKKCSPYAI